jgi:hypothetical protein
MKSFILFFFLAFSAIGLLKGQDKIIDIHMHATKLSSPSVYCAYTTDPLQGARIFSENVTLPCEHLLTSPSTDDNPFNNIFKDIKYYKDLEFTFRYKLMIFNNI